MDGGYEWGAKVGDIDPDGDMTCFLKRRVG